MDTPTVLDIEGSRATLAFNRDDARNALSLELLASAHEHLDELAGTTQGTKGTGGTGGTGGIKVLTLTGSGRAFCAGMDLKQVLDGDETPRRLLESLARLTIKLRSLPMVVIGAVNGAAIGGGCGIACVCDLAITHADAKLGFPEVDLGLCPAVVAPWVVRKVGGGRARAILLAGGTMSGTDAHAMGLVDRLVDSREELMPAADALAESIAGGGERALAATKGLLNELDGSLDESVVLRGAALSADVLSQPEAQEILRARLR